MAPPGGDQSGAVGLVGVEEPVRGGVVGLARVAERPGSGGERDEEVQRQVPRRLVEVHQSGDLRREHALRPLVRLADQVVVVDQPGGVHDAVDAPVGAHQIGDELCHGRPVGDVQGPVFAVRHGLPARPSTQDDVRAGRLLGDVLGQQRAETAPAAGDQVDATGTPHRCGLGARGRFPVADLAASAVVAHVHLPAAELGFQHLREFRAGREPGELDEVAVQRRVLLPGGAQHAQQTRVAGRRALLAHHLHGARPAGGLAQQPLELAEQPGRGVLVGRGGAVVPAFDPRHRHLGKPLAQLGDRRVGDVAEHDEPPGSGRRGGRGHRLVAPHRQAKDLSTHVELRSRARDGGAGLRGGGEAVRHR
ncbi:hypothetical protein GCM10027271_40590 [Saccharopolyspora gloriosae]